MNWWLIPQFGVFGAAWATVVTYSSFSTVNLFVSRQIDVYPYPFFRIGVVLAGVSGTYFLYQALQAQTSSSGIALMLGLTAWFGWTLVMAAVCYRRIWDE
jgi:O-antigen/teichoic acid export membrane protein